MQNKYKLLILNRYLLFLCQVEMSKNKKIKWYFFYLHCWSILYYIYIQQEKKMKKSINENTEKNIEIKATVKAFYKLGISAVF